jgi:DNA repair protein RadC
MFEISTQLSVRERSEGPLITTPDHCANYLSNIEGLAQEAFVTITLNSKNRAISKHLISLGTLNSALVHPREVFRVAILDGAAAMILAHNHPSGDPTPSSEDIKITRQLVSAGEIMGIKVLDHVVLGSAEPGLFQPFVSLRESGLVEFN